MEKGRYWAEEKKGKEKENIREKERNSEYLYRRNKKKLLEKKKKLNSSVEKEVWWLLWLIFWFLVFVYFNLYDSMILRKAFRFYLLLLFINWVLCDFYVLQRL